MTTQPPNPASFESAVMLSLQRLDNSMARIAHAMEALAKHADPTFKILSEVRIVERRTR
jgi:hypothetical protein